MMIGWITSDGTNFLLDSEGKMVTNSWEEKDGKKYIYTITLEDDTVNTAEGIKIGDSFAAVTKAYGTDYVAAGNTYAYSKDKMTLTFVMNNDKVSTISYSLLTSK